jgi:hypothetical protein
MSFVRSLWYHAPKKQLWGGNGKKISLTTKNLLSSDIRVVLFSTLNSIKPHIKNQRDKAVAITIAAISPLAASPKLPELYYSPSIAPAHHPNALLPSTQPLFITHHHHDMPQTSDTTRS